MFTQIVTSNDTLQPSEDQLRDALDQSRAYWHRVAAVANSYHDNGVKSELTNPQHMFWRAPRLQVRPQKTYAHHIGASSSQIPCLQAFVNWRLDDLTGCENVQREKTSITLLHFSTKSAVPFTSSSNSFRQWISTENEEVDGLNYLAILTLGWCYILSACLVGIQGHGMTMEYTGSKGI